MIENLSLSLQEVFMDGIRINQDIQRSAPVEAHQVQKFVTNTEENTGIIDKRGHTVKDTAEGISNKIRGFVKSVKAHAGEMKDKTKEVIGKTVDPDLYEKQIEIPLDHKSYKNISLDDAAKMLGFFTQKMQNQGFPWCLYKVDEESKWKKRVRIDDMEALRRLQNGQGVLFQPKRNMQLDLSPDSLSAAAKIGEIRGGQLESVDKVASFSKNTKVSAGTEGIEVKFGAPLMIENFGELKLLHQLYNPDASIAEKGKEESSKIILPPGYDPGEVTDKENVFGKTAHNLSYYTNKTLGTTYPWRFVRESEGGAVFRMVKSMISKGVPGVLIGAGVGLAIGGPVGLFTGAWSTAITLASYGAALGGGLMAFEGAKDAYKGIDINAFETLSRITENKSVTLQERKKHSINLPIIGNFSWYSDYGKGTEIKNPQELELFTKIEDQG